MHLILRGCELFVFSVQERKGTPAVPTQKEEKRQAFARMRRQIREAKERGDHKPSEPFSKVLDYMVKTAEKADTDSRKKGADSYQIEFAMRLAEFVGKLAEEWTT